jgi:hypothetical protein
MHRSWRWRRNKNWTNFAVVVAFDFRRVIACVEWSRLPISSFHHNSSNSKTSRRRGGVVTTATAAMARRVVIVVGSSQQQQWQTATARRVVVVVGLSQQQQQQWQDESSSWSGRRNSSSGKTSCRRRVSSNSKTSRRHRDMQLDQLVNSILFILLQQATRASLSSRPCKSARSSMPTFVLCMLFCLLPHALLIELTFSPSF